MSSLESLQRQLTSLKELRDIVKIMKAMSAVNIHQYEHAVKALTRYYATIERGLNIVLKELQKPPLEKWNKHELPRLAAIVFGSDLGLCGRFNEEISQFALDRMDSTESDSKNRLILAVGSRVASSLEERGQVIEEEFLVPGSAEQITATVQQILLKVDEWREQMGVYYVYIFYNRHAVGQGYQPAEFELLPINLQRFHRLQEERWPSRSLPTFTMDRESLFRQLLHQYLFVSIFRSCAESQASEHASRLAAMQTAEYNLNDHLDEVTMHYRRARQTAITAELLDVVSGYEILSTADG